VPLSSLAGVNCPNQNGGDWNEWYESLPQ